MNTPARAPRVTVLMTVYNGAAYLHEAMRSVLDQTFEDFEFLIVDDGSRDESPEIVRAFADPRVRLVVNARNMGQTPSLNRGLALARGELLARQDADDVSEPQRLARQVAFLDAHPHVALVGSWYREIDPAGRVLANGSLPCDTTDIRWAMHFYCPFIHASVMWRRELVSAAVGLYDERFAVTQDYDYWSRIVPRFDAANVPEPLVRYRIQPASLTVTHPRAEAELDTVRVTAAVRALGWDPIDVAGNTRRFHVMDSLLYRTWVRWPAAELERAVRDLRALSGWFCDRYVLDARERARHRAAVQRRLRAMLLRHAAGFVQRGPRGDALRVLALLRRPL